MGFKKTHTHATLTANVPQGSSSSFVQSEPSARQFWLRTQTQADRTVGTVCGVKQGGKLAQEKKCRCLYITQMTKYS